MAADPSSFFSDSPEQTYQLGTDRVRARQLGQYFTPYPVARFMARWVAAAHPHTVLDPAVGLGVLLRAVRQTASASIDLIGYDIDPQVLKQARRLWRAQPIHLQQRDYLKAGWQQRVDGIICNPPYLHFRSYANRADLLKEFQVRLGLKLGGQTNLMAFFLLKALNQLSAAGRAAFIMPPEFLNADYGVAVKQYLLAQGSLKHVIVFDAKDGLFANVLTTSCILLFDKADAHPSVLFQRVNALADLEGDLLGQQTHQIAYLDLDPTRKWRHYYQRPQRPSAANLVPLSTYGKVSRGIATGHNLFFTINEEKRQKFALSHHDLLPCLTRASHASLPFFTQAHWDCLQTQGKAVYLVNIQNARSAASRRYLTFGQSQGAHQRYLTRHRQPWYHIEQRPPAPILVTVFNRTGLRFIRNEARVRNLTCFHGLYLNATGKHYLEVLMAYLLTPLARALLKDSAREYGEGLEKYEPNDLNQARVLDLQSVPATVQAEIKSLYRAYRAGVILNQPDPQLLDQLNQRFASLLA